VISLFHHLLSPDIAVQWHGCIIPQVARDVNVKRFYQATWHPHRYKELPGIKPVT
jgi:hypothetical protein